MYNNTPKKMKLFFSMLAEFSLSKEGRVWVPAFQRTFCGHHFSFLVLFLGWFLSNENVNFLKDFVPLTFILWMYSSKFLPKRDLEQKVWEGTLLLSLPRFLERVLKTRLFVIFSKCFYICYTGFTRKSPFTWLGS